VQKMKYAMAAVMFFMAFSAQAVQPTEDPKFCKTQNPSVVRSVQIGKVVNIDGAPWYVFPCKVVERRSTEEIRQDTEIQIKTYLWKKGVL
jgi:hypothetical protein